MALASRALNRLAFMLANFFATGAWTSAYPTFSEIFPTHLRSTDLKQMVYAYPEMQEFCLEAFVHIGDHL